MKAYDRGACLGNCAGMFKSAINEPGFRLGEITSPIRCVYAFGGEFTATSCFEVQLLGPNIR